MFRGIELLEGVEAMRTGIIAAFVNNDVETDFPAVKCAVAMGAVIFGFSRSFITIISLKGRRANLA